MKRLVATSRGDIILHTLCGIRPQELVRILVGGRQDQVAVRRKEAVARSKNTEEIGQVTVQVDIGDS
jgi:hypothetical protein